MQRDFVITSLQINGFDIPIKLDQREAVLTTPSVRLVVHPVWIDGGRDVALVFRPDGSPDLMVDRFEITAPHLEKVKVDHPGRPMPPFYYLHTKIATRALELPVRIDGSSVIGLMTNSRDPDRNPYSVYVRIINAAKAYDIRIICYGII